MTYVRNVLLHCINSRNTRRSGCSDANHSENYLICILHVELHVLQLSFVLVYRSRTVFLHVYPVETRLPWILRVVSSSESINYHQDVAELRVAPCFAAAL